MKTNFKMLGGGLMLSGLLMVGGCGSDNNYVAPVVAPPLQTTAAVDATKVTVAGGTVTTTAAVAVAAPATAPAAVQKAAVAIPTATTITVKNAAGTVITQTAAPTFVFQAPANATTTSAGTAAGLTGSTAPSVLVDVQVQGAASATFSNPITLTLPVPGKAAGSSISDIYKNKNDGKGYSRVGGPYTVSATGTIAVTVSDLCVFTDKIGTTTNTHTTASSGGTQVF